MIGKFARAAVLLAVWIGFVPQLALAQLLPLPPLPLPGGSLVVTLTSPGSGSTVAGVQSITANVSIIGTLTVSRVQFKLDGANLGGADTSAPYSTSWNTTFSANGSHTLTAVASDILGVQFTSNAVTVNVSNAPPPPPADTTAPTVSITSPANGASVAGTVNVIAAASDNVGVAGVQFLLDGAVRADDTSAPFSIPFDTTAVGNGTHTLAAVARDAAGNRKTSATVTITVANAPPADTIRPTVSISAPANGATVSGAVSVTANASDNVGVAGVQFLLDGASLGAEDTAAPFSISWDTSAASAGAHTLTAVARDAAGNRTTSAGVTVTVSRAGTVTRFEESDPSVVAAPAGAWVVRGPEVASFSGGSAGSSDITGATATFSFSGTSVSWRGLKCSICGIATVSIDGGAPVTVNTAGAAAVGSASLASETVFTSPTLVEGAHTLVITVTGTTASSGAHIIVDAFDVTTSSTAAPAGTARIEDSDPSVAYTGTPDWVHGTDPSATGGTFSEAQTAGHVATFRFTGTEVRVIGFRYNGAGIARISIDGAVKGNIDTYAPNPVLQPAVFTATGLARGPHTLTIEVLGTKNPASTDTWIVLDAFDVTP